MRLHWLRTACTQVLYSKELTIITSDYSTENIFYTDGSMIDDVAGYAVQNRNYEKGHQLSFWLKSLQLCIFKYDLVVDI
jgi:hypothetical protein